ncbi:MAG: hypothetical protein U9N73_05190, partial [Candidatus Auribacterota bacterium]|nr:hypothetical protein [Candidatus Auribacterota bacterium]
MKLPEYLNNPWVLIWIFLASGLLTAILTPLVIRFARRAGAIDRGGYRRIFAGDIPLLGGLGVAIPALIFYVGFGVMGSLIVSNWRLISRINQGWLDPLMNIAGDR